MVLNIILALALSTGLDVLANAKREKQDTCFKVPIQRKAMIFNSIDEDEKIGSFGIEDSADDSSRGTHGHAVRRYRGSFIEDNSLSGKIIYHFSTYPSEDIVLTLDNMF